MKTNINSQDDHRGSVNEMLAIALPMIISHACDTIMIFTDRLFLSRLGPELMSASMGGGITVFVMMSFFLGLIGYATALTAQYLGSGNKKNCPAVLTQAIILSLIFFPVILIARPAGIKLFGIMNIHSGQLAPQIVYYNILINASIISLFRFSLSSYFSGIGRTRIVMFSSFAAMIANVFFNYVLIFGKLGFPALGIEGAAYGTIAGGLIGVIAMLAAYFRKNNIEEYSVLKSFHFKKDIMKKLFKFGYPAGLEMFLNLLAFNMMIMIFHARSPVVATAATIVFNWDMVSFVPLFGLEIGVTSLVGRYMGAKEPDIAHRSAMSGLKIGWVYSAFILILFIFFTQTLVNVFTPEIHDPVFTEAVPTAVFMIRLAAVYVLIEAVFVVFVGSLRGAGDTFWTMCYTVTLHWFLVFVLIALFKIWNVSSNIAWATLVFTFFTFSWGIYLRYRKGKWKSIQVVEAPEIPLQDSFHEPGNL